MSQNKNRKLLEGHGILWSYASDEYSYDVYACSPYIKELGDKSYRILLVERIHTKSNNRMLKIPLVLMNYIKNLDEITGSYHWDEKIHPDAEEANY